MSINHLNIQNKQTGDKLSATEFNSTTSKINEVVDGVNASATGGKIGSNGTPLTKDSSGRIIIPLATSSSSGAMSASDKSKLDSINPSGGTGDYVDSISNEANYTANDMYDTTSEFYGTNHKINTRSISYTTSDGSTHTFTHLDTVYKPATASTTINGQVISGKAGLLSPQDKQKLDMMPRPSDITSALSGKADKQIVVLVTRTQQGSTYVYSASKTFTEISTAIGNGTNVILQYGGNYYHLSYSTRDYIVFTRFADDYYMFSSIEVNSHDEWSYSSLILQEELTIDSTPTSGSSNPISSGGVYNALRSNFKTVNGVQLLGSGNIRTQFFINFEQVNGEWSCDWEFSDMKNTYIAGATLRGLIELDGNSYFSDVSEARNNFMRFTWIIPSESGSSPYSIYNQNLLVLEAQEISTGEDMFATVIYQRFNKPIITPTDLRAVAFSGSYSDLSDTPTFKTINGNSIVGSGSVTIDTSMIPYVSQDSHADFQGCVLDEVLNYLDDYKQATLTFDTTPTQNSTNPVTSGGVFSALRYDGNSTNYVASDDSFEDCIESLDSELANKQDTLVSGTNIKTVNGTTLLGSGDIDADDVIMGKIDGTSFYKVTGYSGLNAIPTFSTTAETGDENKIYVDILTNKAYRWNKRIVSVGESKYKLLSEELSIVTDNEINSLLPPSTKKAVSAKVLRDNFYTESEVDTLLGAKQDTLVSGTNIKTINGESLLGSSNITLDTETINYDGDGNTYFAAGDSLTEGLDSMADAIDNINPNEISSVTATESTASGGNNVVTITQTNGTTTSFNVKNGIDGVDGQNGADGVSLGEVALVQTTGSGTDVVMSQDAVTEYGRKVSSVDDEYGSSEYMQTILESLGWAFGKALSAQAALINSTNTCVTYFIPCDNLSGHTVAFTSRCSGSYYIIGYKSDKTMMSACYVLQNSSPTRIYTFGTFSDISYVRLALNINDIPHCYIYDYTDKKYIFKGDEYLNDIYKSYNVGFGYFGKKEVNDYTFIKANYFKGVLSDFYLSEFPNLDPRTCDGISLMLNGKMLSLGNKRMFLEIYYPPTYNVNTGTYFAFADNWGNIRSGLMTSYYQTVSNGTVVSISGNKNVAAHFVITFNFKTGELVVYNNGVEAGRATPQNFDSQALSTYFNGCSNMRFGYFQNKDGNGMTGMAIFPRVLDASDVSTLYGVGDKSTRYELVPQKWQANLLHPLFYSGSNIGIFMQSGATRTTVDDKAVLTATATTVVFGFNGINGLINNVIYEWDMEVVSGEWYPYHNGTARRVMQYNNNYYDVVHIYNTSGTEVTDDNLATGNYHVFCKPNNILAGGINAVSNRLIYRFVTTVDSVIKISNLKVVEQGSALVCDINNFKGDYFEQVNGDKVPKALSGTYNNDACIPYYDTYKDDTIAYSSSAKVQFTGQKSVDVANNKIYIGYLSGNGGSTWKQVNNS